MVNQASPHKTEQIVDLPSVFETCADRLIPFDTQGCMSVRINRGVDPRVDPLYRLNDMCVVAFGIVADMGDVDAKVNST
jgi:hypothetical protein